MQYGNRLKKHASVTERSCYVCDVCGQTFWLMFFIKRHIARHVGQYTPFGFCRRRFGRRYRIKHRHSAAHITDRQSITCKVYDKQDTSMPVIENPYHYSSKNILKRKFDRKPFAERNIMVRKDENTCKSNKSAGRKWHICHICRKKFTGRDTLKRHLFLHKSHISANKNTKKCPICTEFFTRSDNLKRHLRMHTEKEGISDNGVRNNEVKTFYKLLPFKYNILKPEKVGKNNPGETNMHTSNICKEMFKSKDDLMRHLNRHLRLQPNAIHNYDTGTKNLKDRQDQICSEKTQCNSLILVIRTREKTQCNTLTTNTRHSSLSAPASQSCHPLGKETTEGRSCPKPFSSRNPEHEFNICTDNNSVDGDGHNCHICSKQFTTRYALKMHLMTEKHTEMENSKQIAGKDNSNRHTCINSFLCDLCGRTFPRFIELEIHVKLHVEGIRSKRCVICKKPLCTNYYRKVHMMSTHSDGPFPCGKCSALCQTLESFEIHMKSHGERLKICQCYICGKRYSRDYLEYHMKTHVDAGVKPRIFHICYICGKQFTRNTDLNKHLLVHSDERPFSCNICKANFKQKHGLRKHERIHRQKPVDCPYCEKSFIFKHALQQHIVVHTREKKHTCDVCNKQFTQPSSLATHKKIHTGEKRHKCNTCQQEFTQSYALKRHILVHTGEKPHKCDRCDKQFRQIFMLTQHKRKHHS